MVGLGGSIPILKYGITYPIDSEILREFAGMVDEIYVVEEKRGFLEEQVATALQNLYQADKTKAFRIWGKRFPDGSGFPDSCGLNPSITLNVLAPVLKSLRDPTVPVDAERIDAVVALMAQTETYDLSASVRTPSFCPGLPAPRFCQCAGQDDRRFSRWRLHAGASTAQTRRI